jgi:hypothetical protein
MFIADTIDLKIVTKLIGRGAIFGTLRFPIFSIYLRGKR